MIPSKFKEFYRVFKIKKAQNAPFENSWDFVLTKHYFEFFFIYDLDA